MDTPFMNFCIGTSLLSLALSASAALVMWALHFV